MPNSCGKCWGEFKGWLKAFTRIESLLTAIEAIFLILFIVFLVFLIIHFLACGKETHTIVTTPLTYLSTKPNEIDNSGDRLTSIRKRPTCTYTPEDESSATIQMMPVTQANVNYSAVTRKEDVSVNSVITPQDAVSNLISEPQDVHANTNYNSSQRNVTPHEIYDTNDSIEAAELLAADLSDGVLADDDEKQVVLALVRLKPSGVTFGCILTVVDQHWTVTAASCIESIEEVDSLDNFVILDNYGEPRKGHSHTISDVRIHPQYQGNSSFDLALLKTEDALKRRPVTLPSMLEYFRMPIGETAHILGFGHFSNIVSMFIQKVTLSQEELMMKTTDGHRNSKMVFKTIDHSPNGQRVHSATVHLLPARHCQAQQLEERHLLPAAQEARGRCGLAPMCLGVLYARGTPCNYCAGAPLLRGRWLLGVMADNGQCGAACEPARYANMAAARDWIHSARAT